MANGKQDKREDEKDKIHIGEYLQEWDMNDHSPVISEVLSYTVVEIPFTTKYLAAFDFDHTIVNGNSDIVARDLIPKPFVMPDHVKQLYEEKNGWTRFMGEIFKILNERNVSKSVLLTAIAAIPEVVGMVELMRNLIDLNFDIIIISDSNSEFIGCWCEKNGIGQHISAVYTNPADFDENDLLTIRPFHVQTTCKMSAMNLCKGLVLKEHIEKVNCTNGTIYEKVFYIGDGHNDYCPVTMIRDKDIGCARKRYKLEAMLGKSETVKAETLSWENGIDLYAQIKEKLTFL